MRRWLLIGLPWVIPVLLGIGITVQSYNGRVDLVNSQREQCNVAIPERQADAESWYAAAVARQHDAVRRREPKNGSDWAAMRTYMVKVERDMVRLDRAHSLVWPDPATGVPGPYAHPLGFGSYSCEQAFPDVTIRLL